MCEIAFLVFIRDKLNVELAEGATPNDRIVECIALITGRIESLYTQLPSANND